jgi:hypothetical protein
MVEATPAQIELTIDAIHGGKRLPPLHSRHPLLDAFPRNTEQMAKSTSIDGSSNPNLVKWTIGVGSNFGCDYAGSERQIIWAPTSPKQTSLSPTSDRAHNT